MGIYVISVLAEYSPFPAPLSKRICAHTIFCLPISLDKAC